MHMLQCSAFPFFIFFLQFWGWAQGRPCVGRQSPMPWGLSTVYSRLLEACTNYLPYLEFSAVAVVCFHCRTSISRLCQDQEQKNIIVSLSIIFHRSTTLSRESNPRASLGSTF